MSAAFPLCAKIKPLLGQLKTNPGIAPFDTKLVNEVIAEISELHSLISHIKESANEAKIAKKAAKSEDEDRLSDSEEEDEEQMAYKSSVMLLEAAAFRNRRAVLAYIKNRVDRIVDYRFDEGKNLDKEMQLKLSNSEKTYLKELNSNLAEYFGSTQVDVTANIAPTTSLMVQVKGLKDCDELVLDTGSLSIRKGEYYFIHRNDAEQLVRQGLVEEALV